MTGPPTDAIHGLADADIVSAFPLMFNTFQENVNTLRQSASVPRFLYPAKGYGDISLTFNLVYIFTIL